jgi:hypothetical protein
MSYGNDHMINREPQGIWRDQCEAARGMMSRYGLQAAFDYLVGEKLLNCAAAATNHPEFARELPGFVSEVRQIFRVEDIRQQLARIEREEQALATIPLDPDLDFLAETSAECAARRQRHATIRALLIEPQLGTA